jgi:broad-specificity NMP kinase
MNFRSLFKQKDIEKTPNPEPLIVVSGLPRSGTSLMMKMLEAGGIQVVTDHIRTPDDNNPKGYYEFERVKKLKDGDHSWIGDNTGKAVKVISALLEHLPSQHSYKVIFMRRNMEEILASQKQMLRRRGEETNKVSDDKMAELFQSHLVKVETWLENQANFDVIQVNYNELLTNPVFDIEKIGSFLNSQVAIDQMLNIIDPTLYRERNSQSG